MITINDRNVKGNLMWGYCTSCGAEAFPTEGRIATLYAIKIGDWLAYLCIECLDDAHATIEATMEERARQIDALTGARIVRIGRASTTGE